MNQSTFVLDTRDLGRSPGAMRQVQRQVTFDQDLGSSVIAVPAGEAIELDLRLEAVMEGVLVTGQASTHARGECVRCLRPVNMEVQVDLTELFAYPGTAQGAGDVDDEESDPLPELVGDSLDLEATVIDSVVTALPFQPLCEPGCAGLCAQCGVRLDDAEPGHRHEMFDPRWAALAALASSTDGEDSEAQVAPDDPDPDHPQDTGGPAADDGPPDKI
ncbi:MAG TPA: YceD family protein [Beutenbergiaceae bacterium]|nr:YceD family protein [Beutenbergiaceae bacterium]